jgi:ribonucleotide monophosphatase NagD (HAD superfamily)
MDGVIYHGNRLLQGAAEFVACLKKTINAFFS